MGVIKECLKLWTIGKDKVIYIERLLFFSLVFVVLLKFFSDLVTIGILVLLYW